MGVSVVKAIPYGVHARAPDFWKIPYGPFWDSQLLAGEAPVVPASIISPGYCVPLTDEDGGCRFLGCSWDFVRRPRMGGSVHCLRRMYVAIQICVYIYICIQIYICIHIYIEFVYLYPIYIYLSLSLGWSPKLARGLSFRGRSRRSGEREPWRWVWIRPRSTH